MPRIRSLKPEHRQHRKVGPLDHLTYRLWIGMILEADDEGRLPYDPVQLKAAILPYHTVSRSAIDRAVARLVESGLMREYRGEDGQVYLDFPSWGDHQRIDRPRPSNRPSYNDSSNIRRALDESSTKPRADRTDRTDRIGEELDRSGSTAMSSPLDAAPPTPPIAKDWAEAKWPSPEALAHLYNELAPDNVPEVETLSPERRKKAAHHLKAFPSRDWWLEVFSEYRASKFLSGQTAPKAGHENFHPDFDWLLANGKKDHVENAVKVHDGFYR